MTSLNRAFVANLVLALLFGSMVACGPKARGSVTPEGFRSSNYDFQVTATKEGNLMGPLWKIDNLYERRGEWVPKDVGDYKVKYGFDVDGNGTFETEREELAYDLRFEHLRHDGVIFLRTIPISADQGNKKLSVLMDRYVEQIAGAGYEVVVLSAQSSVLVEKRYAAIVEQEGPAKLAGLEAYMAILSVANVDQLSVDPAARKTKVELILLHSPFEYRIDSPRKSDRSRFPTIMLAGYANQPEEFDSSLEEFHEFLNRLVIHGQHGLVKSAALVESALAREQPKSASGPVAPQAAPPQPDASPTSSTATDSKTGASEDAEIDTDEATLNQDDSHP